LDAHRDTLYFFVFLVFPPPPTSTLFPYTTLFRSTPKGVPTVQQRDRGVRRGRPDGVRGRSGGSVRASSHGRPCVHRTRGAAHRRDRKSTRLNSSHVKISYAVFCLKKKKKNIQDTI